MQAGPTNAGFAESVREAEELEDIERAFRELERLVSERGTEPKARDALDALRRALGNARRDAHTDPLTELPNRTWFQRALDDALARCDRHGTLVALLFLDLDGFKEVNDRCGHQAGDLLLAAVARRVLASVREGDLVARYGGDEFVVLLQGLDSPQRACGVAGRIVDAVSTTYAVSGDTFRLSVSVGVAFYPEHARSGEDLTRRADAAMYRAKSLGGRRYEIASRIPEPQERERLEASARAQPVSSPTCMHPESRT